MRKYSAHQHLDTVETASNARTTVALTSIHTHTHTHTHIRTYIYCAQMSAAMAGLQMVTRTMLSPRAGLQMPNALVWQVCLWLCSVQLWNGVSMCCSFVDVLPMFNYCATFGELNSCELGICSHICSHISRPTTSAERVFVQAGSPPSAYSAREQREGELSVALGRHLGQHPHGIHQSSLAPNRATFQDRTIAPNRCIVPESGTAANCCTHEKVAKELGKYYQTSTSWHQFSRVTCCWYKTGHPRCFWL